MLIMVFRINCISSMKTNRLILTKILFTFWKICFTICVDLTGSHETKIWASKTMIMNITPQRMETENWLNIKRVMLKQWIFKVMWNLHNFAASPLLSKLIQFSCEYLYFNFNSNFFFFIYLEISIVCNYWI